MKALKHLFAFAVTCLIIQVTTAQDMLNINDFNFQQAHYNTSYIAGDSSSLDISTIVSAVNATENNNKFHFLLHGTLGKLGLGVGAKVNTSFYQIFQSTTAEILLAKKINVGEHNSLNFGLNAGLALTSIKNNRINQYTDLADPVLTNETFDKLGFMAGFGMNYNWKDRLDLGISLPVLVHSINGVSPVFFTNLGYKQAIGTNFDLKPALMIYGPDYTKPSYEGSVRLDYKDVAWVRVGGRSTKSVIFGAGASVNFIKVGYMYNMVLGNELADVYTGAHNINVSFHFLANKPFGKNSVKNPNTQTTPTAEPE